MGEELEKRQVEYLDQWYGRLKTYLENAEDQTIWEQ